MKDLMIKHSFYHFLSLLILGMLSCQNEQSNDWNIHLPKLCSFSSPRAIDLNQDGVLDIVLGAGENEFDGADSAVIAINGVNGQLLWQTPGWDQMVGSPIFLKIDRDQIPDVIIGGRNGQLLAISGASGNIIWQHFSQQERAAAILADSNLRNFYIPQIIPDQNGDGKSDLLVTYGGDATKTMFDKDRAPGIIFILDSQTGRVIAQITVPDQSETYMSPLCVDLEGNGQLTVLFGTGGESLPGSFYRIPLASIAKSTLSGIETLASSATRGFMSPPVAIDINNDQVKDIIFNAVEGRIIAIDGKTNEEIWSNTIPGTEVYSSIAVGNFTGDKTPDFFTNFGIGIFPNVKSSIQILVDGSTGHIEYTDSLGSVQIGSPLAVDLDGDGIDEGLMTVNHVKESLNANYYSGLFGTTTSLVAFDFKRQNKFILFGPGKGLNAAATPWIGDLDADEKLDLIFTYMSDTITYHPFNGMTIIRKEYPILSKSVTWGSYMGSFSNGTMDPVQ